MSPGSGVSTTEVGGGGGGAGVGVALARATPPPIAPAANAALTPLVVGHSAGAQLAAWAGTRNTLNVNEVGSQPRFRPKRIIALAGPLDMVYAANNGDNRIVAVLGGTPQQVLDRYQSVDPIQNIDPTMPIVAVHGDMDNTVPMALSQRYIDEVERQQGIGEIIIAQGENHLSIVSPNSPAYPRILDIITDVSTKTLEELEVDFRGGG